MASCELTLVCSADSPKCKPFSYLNLSSLCEGVSFGTPGQPSYPQFPTYPGGIGSGVQGGGGAAGGNPGSGSGSKCFGIDPNRNWDAGWAKVGSSGSACQVKVNCALCD